MQTSKIGLSIEWKIDSMVAEWLTRLLIAARRQERESRSGCRRRSVASRRLLDSCHGFRTPVKHHAEQHCLTSSKREGQRNEWNFEECNTHALRIHVACETMKALLLLLSHKFQVWCKRSNRCCSTISLQQAVVLSRFAAGDAGETLEPGNYYNETVALKQICWSVRFTEHDMHSSMQAIKSTPLYKLFERNRERWSRDLRYLVEVFHEEIPCDFVLAVRHIPMDTTTTFFTSTPISEYSSLCYVFTST